MSTNKEAAEHSRLPWEVFEHDFICSGETTVAELGYTELSKEVRRANAELIVTAVNERERLREALRQVHAALPSGIRLSEREAQVATIVADALNDQKDDQIARVGVDRKGGER